MHIAFSSLINPNVQPFFVQMDKIRKAGQFAFWKDDMRKRIYTSVYVWHKNNLRRTKTDESTTQNAE